jgi:hypothetical protein
LGFGYALGCGSTRPAPPVIDSLTMPATATLGASGTYDLTGTLHFHDDDDGVATLRVRLPALALSYDTMLAVHFQRGDLPIALHFSASTPKGDLEYQVNLIDLSGLESVPRTEHVTLQ